MRHREIRYFFGRLNLIANYSDKKQFLLKVLKTKRVLGYRQFNWGFFDISEMNSDLSTFIHGYLVKYKQEFSEEIANPETHNLEDRSIDNFVVAKSRFFIHVNSGIISYHPIGNVISRKAFALLFCKLFVENLDNMFVNAEIQAIEENYEVKEAVKAFSKIQHINIYLHPSNPSNRKLWENTDNRLKKLGAASYHESYEADPKIGTLNIQGDEDITSKIIMAEDGYGKADITGMIDGKEKTISTSDNPISAFAPNDNSTSQDVLNTLMQYIKDIFKRFNNGN